MLAGKRLWCIVVTLLLTAVPSVAGAAELSTASVSTDVASVAPTGGQVVVTLTSTSADSCTLRVTPSLPGWPITVAPCDGAITRNVSIPADADTMDRVYAFKAKVTTGATTAATNAALVTQQHRIRVAAFGDSVMYQAVLVMSDILGRTTAAALNWTAFPGLVMCQITPFVKNVSASFHPDLVIIEFLGTNFAACSKQNPRRSPAWIAAYRAATIKAVNAALDGNPNTKVELVDAPTWGNNVSGSTDIAKVYQAVADLNPTRVSYINAGLSVEGLGGSYVGSLPCLAIELVQNLCTGRGVTTAVINGIPTKVIKVRSPDKVHLCLLLGRDGILEPPGCSSYSSGAYRYSAAMLIPGLQAFGLSPLPDLHP